MRGIALVTAGKGKNVYGRSKYRPDCTQGTNSGTATGIGGRVSPPSPMPTTIQPLTDLAEVQTLLQSNSPRSNSMFASIFVLFVTLLIINV